MLSDRLKEDLMQAMRARDQSTVKVLRTTLAAIANAEAPRRDDRGPAPAPVYGRLEQHPRLLRSDADVEQIVRNEVEERQAAIGQYIDGGRQTEADALRDEVSVLRRYLT